MVTFDLKAFAQAIAAAIMQAIQGLLGPVPAIFLRWLGDQIHELWFQIWHSGANILATPLDITENYAPAVMLGNDLQLLPISIAVLAAALLGLRAIWQSVTGVGSEVHDLMNGLFLSMLLAGASGDILIQAYYLTRVASDVFGQFIYTPAFDPHSMLTLGQSFLLTALILLLMIVASFKLVLKAAYRLVYLMFLTPFAPVASIMWAFPQTRWIATAYWYSIGGWLAGGVLAVGALSLGVQIAGMEGGLLALVFSVGLVKLAEELLDLLPRWAFGLPGTPRIGIPNVLGAAAGAIGGAAAGAAAGASAGAAYGTATGALGSVGTIGTLSAPALGPGTD